MPIVEEELPLLMDSIHTKIGFVFLGKMYHLRNTVCPEWNQIPEKFHWTCYSTITVEVFVNVVFPDANDTVLGTCYNRAQSAEENYLQVIEKAQCQEWFQGYRWVHFCPSGHQKCQVQLQVPDLQNCIGLTQYCWSELNFNYSMLHLLILAVSYRFRFFESDWDLQCFCYEG